MPRKLIGRWSRRKSTGGTRQRRPLRLAAESLEDRTLLFGTQIVLFDLPVFGKPIHEGIPLKALPFVKPEIVHDIAEQNEHEDLINQFSSSHHFDNNAFVEGRNEINDKYQLAVAAAKPGAFDNEEVIENFGRLLHAAQDFYSHTNWVDMGKTQLVENGAGLWRPFTPYSLHSGAMLVQGEDETPMTPFGEATLTLDPRDYDSNGTPDHYYVYVNTPSGIFPGIISGSVYAVDDTPDNVAVDHGNNLLVGQPGPGLSKDDPFVDDPQKDVLFRTALDMAGQQTAHEFYRLLRLIEAEYGTYQQLIDAWVMDNDPSTPGVQNASFDAFMAAQTPHQQGRTGDVIAFDLKALFPDAKSFEPISLAGLPGGTVLYSDEVDGQPFASSGRFYFIPTLGADPADANPSVPGFQGSTTAKVKVDGVVEIIRIDVADGITADGPGAITGDTSKLDILRLQQRLNYFGYPGADGKPLALNGDASDLNTRWAVALFNAAMTDGTVPPQGLDLAKVRRDYVNDPKAPHWEELTPGAGYEILTALNGGPQPERWATSFSSAVLKAAGTRYRGINYIQSISDPLGLRSATLQQGGDSTFHNSEPGDHEAGLHLDFETISSNDLFERDANGQEIVDQFGNRKLLSPFFGVVSHPSSANPNLRIWYVEATNGGVIVKLPGGGFGTKNPATPGFNWETEALTAEEAWDNRPVLLAIRDLMATPSYYNLNLVRDQIRSFLLLKTPVGGEVGRILYNDPRTWATLTPNGTVAWNGDGTSPNSLVQFAPGHGGVFHVDVLAPVVDTPLPPGQSQAILDGLKALIDRIDDLGFDLAFTAPIPGVALKTGLLADDLTYGEALDMKDSLMKGLFNPVAAYLAGTTTPTARGLAEAIATAKVDLGTLHISMQPDSVTGGLYRSSTGQELRFNLVLTADRTTAAVIDFGVNRQALGLSAGNDATVDVQSRIRLDLSFGIDLQPGLPTNEAFFVRVHELTPEVHVHEHNLNFSARVGFLEADVQGGSIDLDAILPVRFIDPDPISSSNLTRSELEDFGVADLVRVDPIDGGFQARMSFHAALGAWDTGGTDPAVDLVDTGGLYSGQPPALLANADFAELKNFTNITANTVIELLRKQVGTWWRSLGASTILDVDVPFAKDVSVGDLLKIDEAYQSINDKLYSVEGEPSNQVIVPKFETAQQLAALLGQSFGYDPVKNELTFGVKSLSSAVATTVAKIADDYNILPVNGLKSLNDVSITTSVALSFILGINLETVGDPTKSAYQESFFIDSPDLDGKIVVQADELEATGRFAVVGIDTTGGKGTSTMFVGLKPDDPSLPAVPRIFPAKNVPPSGPIDAIFNSLPVDVDISGSARFELHHIAPKDDFIVIDQNLKDPTITFIWDNLGDEDSRRLEYNADMDSLSCLDDLALIDPTNVYELRDLIVPAVNKAADFLANLATATATVGAFTSLNGKLPVIQQDLNQLTNYANAFRTKAQTFANAITKVEEFPKNTIQYVQQKLNEAFGLPAGTIKITLDCDYIGFEIPFSTGSITTTEEFSLDLSAYLAKAGGKLAGISSLVDSDATGSVMTTRQADLKLNLGVNIDDESDNFLQPYLVDSTNLDVAFRAIANQTLEFQTKVGLLGAWVNDGSATLDQDGDPTTTSPGRFTAKLKNAGADHRLYFDELLGNLGAHLDTKLDAGLTVKLPLFGPTENTPLVFEVDKNGNKIPIDKDPKDGLNDHIFLLQVADLSKPTDTATVVTPDFSKLFSTQGLLGQLQTLVDGLNSFLSGLSSSLAGKALGGVSLPLLGDALSNSKMIVDQFQSTVINKLQSVVNDAAGKAIAEVEGLIQQALFDVFGAQLKILKDGPDAGTNVTKDDVLAKFEGTATDPTSLQFSFTLGQILPLGQFAIDFAKSMPLLGLNFNAGLKVDLDWSLPLTIGMSKAEGFFYDASAANEMTVGLNAVLVKSVGGTLVPSTANDPVSVSGTIANGLLSVLASDRQDPGTGNFSSFTGTFSIDIVGPGNGHITTASLGAGVDVKARLQAQANLLLKLQAMIGNSPDFPSIGSDFRFYMAWGTGLGDSSGGDTSADPKQFGTAPLVEFTDASIDLGKVVSKVVGPLMENIKKILEPLHPFFEMLRQDLPILSEIDAVRSYFGGDGGVSIIDVAAKFLSTNPWFMLFQAFNTLEEVSHNTNFQNQSLLFKLGDFRFGGSGSGASGVVQDARAPGFSLANIDPKQLDGTIEKGLNAIKKNFPDSPLKSFILKAAENQYEKLKGAGRGLIFPFVDDPTSAFRLLLGQDIDLVQYDLPTFTDGFNIDVSGDIFGGYITAHLKGGYHYEYGLDFGYDTSGMRAAAKASGAGDIAAALINGFYVTGDIRNGGAPYAKLGGLIDLGGSLNTPDGFIVKLETAANGRLEANLEVSLCDPNGDDKVRWNEIKANWDAGGLAGLFDAQGELSAHLDAKAIISVGVPYPSFERIGGPWYAPEYAYVTRYWENDLINETWAFDKTFFKFDMECATHNGASDAIPEPVLATYDEETGVLTLNMGPNAKLRGTDPRVNTEDGAESFGIGAAFDANGVAIGPVDGEKQGKAVRLHTLVVSAFGVSKSFSNVTKVVALAGLENDTIVVDPGTSVDVEFDGGDQDDILTYQGIGSSTLRGGDGEDQLQGSDQADALFGDDGNDTLHGGGGNDRLDGGSNNDDLFGDDGNDTLNGSAGNDTLDGGNQADTLRGGDNDDRLSGGEGDDLLEGGNDNDRLDGGRGIDTLKGEAGNDTLKGGSQGDSLEGGLNNDRLYGDDGDDTLHGQDGDDTLSGGTGGDSLFGGNGSDNLAGGSENDTLYGGDQPDTLDGGIGNDSLFGEGGGDLVIGGTGNDTVDGGTGNDTILGDDSVGANGGRDLIYGGLGDDNAHGGGGNDTLYGGYGPDRPIVNDGNDTLNGDAGDDLLVGGDQNDSLQGGIGNDTLFGGIGDDAILGEGDRDVLYGEVGQDSLDGGASNDSMFGGAGNDEMQGAGGGDTILGEAGHDSMQGGTGRDTMYGGTGNDTMWGDDGDDQMWGDADADLMHSGTGRDTMYGNRDDDTLVGSNGPDALTPIDDGQTRLDDERQRILDQIEQARPTPPTNTEIITISVPTLAPTDSITPPSTPSSSTPLIVSSGGPILSGPTFTSSSGPAPQPLQPSPTQPTVATTTGSPTSLPSPVIRIPTLTTPPGAITPVTATRPILGVRRPFTRTRKAFGTPRVNPGKVNAGKLGRAVMKPAKTTPKHVATRLHKGQVPHGPASFFKSKRRWGR